LKKGGKSSLDRLDRREGLYLRREEKKKGFMERETV